MKGVCVFSYFCRGPYNSCSPPLMQEIYFMESSGFAMARLGGNAVPETTVPFDCLFLRFPFKDKCNPWQFTTFRSAVRGDIRTRAGMGRHRLASEAQSCPNSLPALYPGHTFGTEGFMYNKPGLPEHQEAPLSIPVLFQQGNHART